MNNTDVARLVNAILKDVGEDKMINILKDISNKTHQKDILGQCSGHKDFEQHISSCSRCLFDLMEIDAFWKVSHKRKIRGPNCKTPLHSEYRYMIN